jgi:hypothetical protein
LLVNRSSGVESCRLCAFFVRLHPRNKGAGYINFSKTSSMKLWKYCAGRSLYTGVDTDNMSILGLTIDYGPYGLVGSYNQIGP